MVPRYHRYGIRIRSKYGSLGGPVIVFLDLTNFPLPSIQLPAAILLLLLRREIGNCQSKSRHPGTTKIFAEAALKALISSNLPPATVSIYISHRAGFGF